MDRRVKSLLIVMIIASLLLVVGCGAESTLDTIGGEPTPTPNSNLEIDLSQYQKIEIIEFHVADNISLNYNGEDEGLIITTIDQAREVRISDFYPQITEEFFETGAIVVMDVTLEKQYWFAEFYGLYLVDNKICPVIRQVDRETIDLEAKPTKYSFVVRVDKEELTQELGEVIVLEKNPQDFGLLTVTDEPYEIVEMYSSRTLTEIGAKQEDLGIVIVDSLSDLQELSLELGYSQELFENKALVICSVQCCTGMTALEMSGLVLDNGELCPVVRIFESNSQATNSFYVYVMAEVPKEIATVPAGKIHYIGSSWSNSIWDISEPNPRPQWTYGLP